MKQSRKEDYKEETETDEAMENGRTTESDTENTNTSMKERGAETSQENVMAVENGDDGEHVSTNEKENASVIDELEREEEEKLPPNWEKRTDVNGRSYYIDHVNKKSQWPKPTMQPKITTGDGTDAPREPPETNPEATVGDDDDGKVDEDNKENHATNPEEKHPS